MYEVFLNDRKIIIAAPGKITFNKTSQIINNLHTVKTIEKWFLEFIKSNIQNVVLLHSSPKYFFENLFQPTFKVICAAGGVVKRGNRFLFILRNKKWDLPKGKIDDGETSEEAAIREVAEECGINEHKIVKQLPSTFHIYQSPYKESKGEWIFKETFWYEMEYSGLGEGEPQKEENITDIKWFEKGEFEKVIANTYDNLKTIIHLYRD